MENLSIFKLSLYKLLNLLLVFPIAAFDIVPKIETQRYVAVVMWCKFNFHGPLLKILQATYCNVGYLDRSVNKQ